MPIYITAMSSSSPHTVGRKPKLIWKELRYSTVDAWGGFVASFGLTRSQPLNYKEKPKVGISVLKIIDNHGKSCWRDEDFTRHTAGQEYQICIWCMLSVLNNIHRRSEVKSSDSRTDMVVNTEGSMSLACQSFHSKFFHTVQDVIHSEAIESRLHNQCWSEQNWTRGCSHQSHPWWA